MVAPDRSRPTLQSGATGQTKLPVVVISGRIGISEIQTLCGRVQALFAADQDTVAVDVSGVVEPDLAALDALARLHLTAQRMGRRVRILHTCEQLEELVAFAGLGDVLCLKD